MKKHLDETPVPERRRQPTRRQGDALLGPDFKDLIEGSAQGILIHTHFKPLYVNAAFARLFGYGSPQEVMAMPLVRPLYPSENWAEVEERHDAFVRGEARETFSRLLGVRKDGERIWLSATKRLINWHGSQAVQLSVFDISHQVRMEELMLDNEQQLRAMLEILPVPIIIARRRDGRILFVNRKVCLLFQQSARPLLKGSAQDFFASSGDWSRVLGMMDAVHDLREVEVLMKTASDQEFMAELAAIKMVYGEEPAMLVSINDISERKKLEAELFYQANTDALTDISNRRFFMIQAEQELRRARRFSRNLSIVMMDLDHFKHINDTYGHAAGDFVLETVVRTSLGSLRGSDIMGRLGGEEFAIILPETDVAAAREVATRLLVDIARKPIEYGGKTIHCTTSLGIAQLQPNEDDIDAFLSRADEALFRAKNEGRNRIEIAK